MSTIRFLGGLVTPAGLADLRLATTCCRSATGRVPADLLRGKGSGECRWIFSGRHGERRQATRRSSGG